MTCTAEAFFGDVDFTCLGSNRLCFFSDYDKAIMQKHRR